MKTRRVLLYIAGAVMFLAAVLHLTFWSQYHWGEELSWLNHESRGVILSLWIGTIYMSLFNAGISFYIGSRKTFGVLEKTICAYMAGVFVLRIAMGVPLMGYSAWEVAFEVVCALVALCYLLPLRTAGGARE
jgi:hypothetical protein